MGTRSPLNLKMDWIKEVADFASSGLNDPDFAVDFEVLNKACQIIEEYAGP
jgi:hypothetical protein